MKKIFLIGIGPGDPKYLTIQAIDAMNQVDVFFFLEKEGRGKDDLIKIRKSMMKKYATKKKYRAVSARDPERDVNAGPYEKAVDEWRNRRRDVVAGLIKSKMKENQTGAFLIWGDPSLYDGSIEILQSILAAGELRFDYEIVPGITSIQALAEKHRIPLNRTGEAIEITTGRRLNEKKEHDAENIVVLLDQASALKKFPDRSADLYWGGYLGTKDEILLSGKLADVVHDYDRLKTQARERKGWIMDTYILRKRKPVE